MGEWRYSSLSLNSTLDGGELSDHTPADCQPGEAIAGTNCTGALVNVQLDIS